jgi:hypothetical protein
MSDSPHANPPRSSIKTVILILIGAVLLIGFGVLLEKHERKVGQDELGMSNLDKVTAVVRERRNRLEVMKLRGIITTVRETSGGIGGFFDGKLVIRQPFSTGYFVDMSRMKLSDYIWDEKSRTLFVRLPAVTVDPPAIDATRQEVAVKGWVITRDMQNRLRRSVAQGADQQARTEANKPENLETARSRAIEAITRNLEQPLNASGISDIHIEVLDPRRNPSEQWDVSRSIAEVLAGRG